MALAASTSFTSRADRCEVLRDFGQLEALAGEWDRLWSSDARGEVFQSFAWNRAWWKACGNSVQLCTPVVYAGSKVLGILPLIRRAMKDGNGWRFEFLGSPHADYTDVICEEGDTVQVLRMCFDELHKLRDWQEGFFDGLPEESRMARHFADLPPATRTNLQLVGSEQCYTIQLGEKSAEILDGLARKQHLRRRQNKLEKSGKVVFRHLETVDEALAHLELFFVSQRRRRAIHGKSSAAEQEDFRDLLRHLIRDFDLKHDLHFGVLELNEKPIAWHISFETNQKLVFYQQTFEVDAWDFAPGEALLRYLLLFAKGRVTREFDFTRGDEPFKARFGNHRRQIYQLWLQPRGVRGRISGMRRTIAGSLDGRLNKLRAAAKAEKGIFERWRAARAWWNERANVSSRKMGSSPEDGQTAQSSNLSSGLSLANQSVVVYLSPEPSQNSVPASSPLPSANENTSALSANISPAGLGDLVDFAQQNPHILPPTRVLDLRERLRLGDQAFVQRTGMDLLRVVWVTHRPLREVLDVAELPQAAQFQAQAMLTLYELWEAESALRDLSAATSEPDRGSPDTRDELIDFFQQEAARRHVPLYVCCRQDARAVSKVVELLGFRKILELKRGKVVLNKMDGSVQKG